MLWISCSEKILQQCAEKQLPWIPLCKTSNWKHLCIFIYILNTNSFDFKVQDLNTYLKFILNMSSKNSLETALLSVTQMQINLVSGYKASMLILKHIWNMTHKYFCNASHFGRYLTLFILVVIWHKSYTLLKTYLLMQLKLKTNYLFRVPGFLGKKARYALKWNIHNLIYIYKLYIFTIRISHENYLWEYP